MGAPQRDAPDHAVPLTSARRARNPTHMRAPRSVLALLVLVACTTSTRSKAINDTLLGTNAAVAAFEAYDKLHQVSLASSAPDKATGEAELAAWAVTVAKVEKAIADTYKAITAAQGANDDPSLAAAVTAGKVLLGILTDVGVKL